MNMFAFVLTIMMTVGVSPPSFDTSRPLVWTCTRGEDSLTIAVVPKLNQVYHQSYLVPADMAEITEEKIRYAVVLVEHDDSYVMYNEIDRNNNVMTTAIFEGLDPETNKIIDQFDTLCLYDGPHRR